MDQLLLCLQLIWFVGEGRAFELQYKELQQPLQQQGNPATTSLQVTSINDLPIQPSSTMAGVPASGECHEIRRQPENFHMLPLPCYGASWHHGMLQQRGMQRNAACRICKCMRHCPIAAEAARSRGPAGLAAVALLPMTLHWQASDC